jgi:quercetin dioxygenase-like cupin family protein
MSNGEDAVATDLDVENRSPIVLDHDAGEALWFNNDLLTFKATGRQTHGAYLLLEEVARQGKVTPLHAHPAEQETFYILDGEAIVHLDGDERTVAAGALVSFPPGLPHAYLVTSAIARVLILVTPGTGAMEQFFRHAGEPAPERALPENGPLDIEKIAAAAERTGAVEILGPPPFGGPPA